MVVIVNHPPIAEERRQVLFDPAFRIRERALPIRLVVVQRVLGRSIKCDPAHSVRVPGESYTCRNVTAAL